MHFRPKNTNMLYLWGKILEMFVFWILYLPLRTYSVTCIHFVETGIGIPLMKFSPIWPHEMSISPLCVHWIGRYVIFPNKMCIKFLEFEEMSVFSQIHQDARLYEVNSDDFPIDAKINSWILKDLCSGRYIIPLHVLFSCSLPCPSRRPLTVWWSQCPSQRSLWWSQFPELISSMFCLFKCRSQQMK